MIDEEYRDYPMDRMTVSEAAEILRVTQSAIRKRIQRGTIPWDKDDEGRIFVYVDSSETSHETGDDRSQDMVSGPSRDELVSELRDQVDFLRRELERKDTLLMSLMQRIPELEPTREPQQAPSRPEDAPVGNEDQAFSSRGQREHEKRSWWRQFFGF